MFLSTHSCSDFKWLRILSNSSANTHCSLVRSKYLFLLSVTLSSDNTAITGHLISINLSNIINVEFHLVDEDCTSFFLLIFICCCLSFNAPQARALCLKWASNLLAQLIILSTVVLAIPAYKHSCSLWALQDRLSYLVVASSSGVSCSWMIRRDSCILDAWLWMIADTLFQFQIY